jgi:hypothetical protein
MPDEAAQARIRRALTRAWEDVVRVRTRREEAAQPRINKEELDRAITPEKFPELF